MRLLYPSIAAGRTCAAGAGRRLVAVVQTESGGGDKEVGLGQIGIVFGSARDGVVVRGLGTGQREEV